MTGAWVVRYRKRDRMDLKRRLRLVSKAQKARAMDKLNDVMRLRSWSRRFGQVARLRSERKSA